MARHPQSKSITIHPSTTTIKRSTKSTTNKFAGIESHNDITDIVTGDVEAWLANGNTPTILECGESAYVDDVSRKTHTFVDLHKEQKI